MSKRTGLKSMIIGLVATLLLLSIAQAGAAEKVHKWRCQTYAVPGSVGYKALEESIAELKEATNGQIDISLYGVGTLVGPFEQLEAVGNGIFECSFNAGGYYAGNDPAFAAFFSLIGVWPSTDHVKIWANYFGGNDLVRELYAKYGVHYVGPALVGAEPIMSNVPLRSLKDFEGIKIRTAGGLGSELFKRLGASPVKLGGGELYTALDTNVVNAAEFVSLAENYDMGLHEVTDYVLYPSFHGPIAMCDFTVNQRVWDSLPDHLQAQLNLWVHELDAKFDYMSRAESLVALQKMKEYGVEHTTLSDDDMEKAKQISLEIAEDWKEKSPMSEKIIDSIISYLKLAGEIK
ncbi:MAG: TRAP transporter substrate-binding protein DctP [Desulfovermiculus sp.]|nr:TRAP transporter substrate-binding protein DctP [Desulfovermiculus sp.]